MAGGRVVSDRKTGRARGALGGATAVDTRLSRLADVVAAAAVVRVVCDVHLAAVPRISVTIGKALVTGSDDALSVETSRNAVRRETDVAAGAAIVDIVLEIEAVVRRPITVVIKTVTGFCLRQHFADTWTPRPSCHARLGASCADANSLRPGRTAVARAALAS